MIVLFFLIETNDSIAHATGVEGALWRIGWTHGELEHTRSHGIGVDKKRKRISSQ